MSSNAEVRADEALAQLSAVEDARIKCEPLWLEVEQKQNECLAARKRLTEDTKAFKKLSDEERMVRWPELLKAYQTEIDALWKRAKISESSFFEMLVATRSAPEVAAMKKLLRGQGAEQSIGKGSSQLEAQLRQKEGQVSKLTEEVRDLEEELKNVKNQEVTVRRLQKQVKEMEDDIEEKVAEAMEEKDAEWGNRFEELRQELAVQRQMHQDALAQLADHRELAHDEVERMRQQHLEELRLAEQAVLARGAEADALSSDLERVQLDLERERALRREADTSGGAASQGSAKVLQSLLDGVQQRASGLERETADLRLQLSESESRLRDAEEQHRLEIARLAAESSNRSAEMHVLEEQLASRPSQGEVDALRHQLANVEAVKLADVDAASSDLERRSLQRQRLLEDQLNEANGKSAKLEKDISALHSRLQSEEDKCNDLRRLVQRLETELSELSGDSTSKVPSSGKEPALAGLLTVADLQGTSAAEVAGLTGGTGSDAMPSMLDMVIGQRDRLRERAGELEQERDRWRSSAEHERKRAETLHGDNVKLLERTRFLQSYQPKHGRPPPRGRIDQDLEGRYQAREDGLGITPFEQFQKDEKAKKIAAMNPGERVLVTLSAILMASKPARVITLSYLSAMHLLVLLVLMRLAHNAHRPCG